MPEKAEAEEGFLEAMDRTIALLRMATLNLEIAMGHLDVTLRELRKTRSYLFQAWLCGSEQYVTAGVGVGITN